MNQSRNYLIPIILVTSLFFLWAFLHNINPVLIPHLKKACQLTDTQSAFIDTAVYIAYFTIALPAGWFMHKYGYKKGILFGLTLYAAGALLFIPAASSRRYLMFLFALFVIAAGATFLETVANPYMAKLGDEKTGARRLNLAQSFNGVGAFLAPIIGGKFILSGVEYTSEQLNSMSNLQVQSYLQSEANAIKGPYWVIAAGVLFLLLLFAFSKLPEVAKSAGTNTATNSGGGWKVLRIPQVKWAVVAQFFYVGAQVGVGSFFIRFARQVVSLPEKEAAYWWGSIAMVGFMLGRFAGTFLMKYIRAERLLAFYSLVSILLLFAAVFTSGKAAVYALMAVPFFMSIMFPTIFALGIRNLGEETKTASSFIIMSIVGGAIFPLLMGKISDVTDGNIQLGYLVPFACFVVVLIFALGQKKVFETNKPAMPLAH